MADHKHGKNFAYGKREECPRCIAEDAAFEKARKHYAEQARQAAKFVDGEPVKVNADGIIVLEKDEMEF